jgi:hypothetical protein
MLDPIENPEDSALIRQQRSVDYKIADDFVGNIMTKLKLHYFVSGAVSAFELLEQELTANFDLVPEKTMQTPQDHGNTLSTIQYYIPKTDKLASDEFIFICTQTRQTKIDDLFQQTSRSILIESRDNPDGPYKNIIAWRKNEDGYLLNA